MDFAKSACAPQCGSHWLHVVNFSLKLIKAENILPQLRLLYLKFSGATGGQLVAATPVKVAVNTSVIAESPGAPAAPDGSSKSLS